MSIRKIIVYNKGATKPIIITDESNQSMEEIQKQILDILSSTKIGFLNTKNDILIIRPSEIQSILITKNFNDISNLADEDAKDKKNYKEGLSIEKTK